MRIVNKRSNIYVRHRKVRSDMFKSATFTFPVVEHQMITTNFDYLSSRI